MNETAAKELWSTIRLSKFRVLLRELAEFLGWLALLVAGLSVTATFVLLYRGKIGSNLGWPGWLAAAPLVESMKWVFAFGGLLMGACGFVLRIREKHIGRQNTPVGTANEAGGAVQRNPETAE